MNLLDRLVAHERNDTGVGGATLRPRLPYAFDAFDALALEQPGEAPTLALPRAQTDAPREPALPVVAPDDAPVREEVPHVEAAPRFDRTPHASPGRDAHAPPGATAATSRAALVATTPSPSSPEPHAKRLSPPPRGAAKEESPTSAMPITRSPARTAAVAVPEREAVRVPSRKIARDVREPIMRSVPPIGVPARGSEPAIEIVIGRIDVRAPLASPSPPSPVARTASAASDGLGDYLRRRSRGSRS